jgi:hypothetical protein
MENKINTHGLEDLIEHLLDKGMSEEDAAKEVADILDSLIPLDSLGSIGKILEIIDGPTILLIVKAIQKSRGTPEEREARKIKREERKKTRREKRKSSKLEIAND